MSRRRLAWLLGLVGVYTTVGGVLGVLLPRLRFTSPLAVLVPQSLQQSNLQLQAVLHPGLSQVQTGALGPLRDARTPRSPTPTNGVTAWPCCCRGCSWPGRRSWHPAAAQDRHRHAGGVSRPDHLLPRPGVVAGPGGSDRLSRREVCRPGEDRDAGRARHRAGGDRDRDRRDAAAGPHQPAPRPRQEQMPSGPRFRCPRRRMAWPPRSLATEIPPAPAGQREVDRRRAVNTSASSAARSPSGAMGSYGCC